ncbi:nuclease-related domain-containing protein [Shewanella fidelis]|uniref:NERD domain-containing protein n=1 Tax=Shewanella fidelis TaxID=173509 RepID=A0AAW8NKH5_9GAMM|nr:NERD domain-containing protein [Shewanella fidelis]MDR8522229.1 NERD domain-containing protein [Shewanella fidelis]MDW4812555.1 NERD domain-containing protein [Shewanella fidelis]MDW4816302.1 NERD domain-containing protein [Shewanella fidelis]MDW4820796.1 NERD domain-containing protein [Shewanella fidelis]MDW4825018.1 NERD domain-containing protein [Shewanella fidelis]
MILKTKSPQNVQSAQAIAGQQQEQNVAFFLRRAYKDHPQVLVINDFKFLFNDEVAQIDHLIIYSYGFILIESKSIRGRVKVNQQQEWTRSIGAKWQGIPSPIKQVELQQALLLELLMHHRSEILGKLLGFKQQGFKGRCWDHLCAVSSDAIIDRKSMPKAVSDKLIKSEFLVDKLDKVMNLKSTFQRAINFSDTRPDFSQQELESVASFLIKQHIAPNTAADTETAKATSQTTIEQDIAPLASTPIPAASTVPVQQMPDQAIATEPAPLTETEKSQTIQIVLRCKHCEESTNYTPMYGKFGYYIHCKQCTKNTPMKQACPQCSSKNTRVQKRQETYTLNCQECGCGQQLI